VHSYQFPISPERERIPLAAVTRFTKVLGWCVQIGQSDCENGGLKP
jgi:hypothetical protein